MLLQHPNYVNSATHEELSAVSECASVENNVNLFKLLGSQIVKYNEEKILCDVHTKNLEENAHLPLRLFDIMKLPGTDYYRMKPREIMFFINLDVSLSNLMMRSSFEDMIKCYRKIQSQIFDLVHRNIVYLQLCKEPGMKSSISCTKDRRIISFTLPLAEDLLISHEKQSAKKNITSYLRMLSISISYDPLAKKGWRAQLYSPSHNAMQRLSSVNEQILRKFIRELPQQDAVSSIQNLLKTFVTNNTDEDDTSDEFDAMF